MYALRIPIVIAFVAAAARLLLDAPPSVPYALAGGLAAVIIGERALRWFKLRRHLAGLPWQPDPGDYVQCEARMSPFPERPLLTYRCCLQGQHEGQHEGSLRDSLEWPR